MQAALPPSLHASSPPSTSTQRRPGKRLEQVQCSLKKAANYRALAHHNPHRTMEYYKEVNRELLKANALCRTGDSGDLLCSPEMHPGLFATELQRGHLCAEMGNLQKAYTHYQMACKTAQARQQYCKGAERTQATHDIVDAVCKMCDCVRKFAASGRYLSDAQMRNVDIMMDSAKAAAASIDAVGMHFILYAQIVIYEYKENWKKLHELKDDEQVWRPHAVLFFITTPHSSSPAVSTKTSSTPPPQALANGTASNPSRASSRKPPTCTRSSRSAACCAGRCLSCVTSKLSRQKLPHCCPARRYVTHTPFCLHP